jgi:hypothetical protein
MMKKYVSVILVIVFGAAGSFVIANRIRKPTVSAQTGPAFVVHQLQRENGNDTRRIVRSYRTNGEWMEITTDIGNGVQHVIYSTKDAGVVSVNNEKKESQFIGGWSMPASAEQIRSDPQFKDESEILGYRVLRIHMEESDGTKTDLYKAPDLQGMILRIEVTDSNGHTLSLEPEKIQLTQTDFSIPSYPINRDLYNSRHAK